MFAITECRCDFTPAPVPAITTASNGGDKSSALSKHNGGYPSNGLLCWARATPNRGTRARAAQQEMIHMWMGARSCRDWTELQCYCKSEALTSHFVLLRSSCGSTHASEQQYTTLSRYGVKGHFLCGQLVQFKFFFRSLLLLGNRMHFSHF